MKFRYQQKPFTAANDILELKNYRIWKFVNGHILLLYLYNHHEKRSIKNWVIS